MDIYELVNKYINAGYSENDAIPKVAQDIVLLKIGNSKYNKNITVKGGVVIHNISKDMRRATRDMDIDFIKYSLEDKSIRDFIKELNNTEDDIKIKIIGKIEPLHHQDYDGKRVYIQLIDKNKYTISSKLDIGVHKYFDMEQDEYYFDLNIIDESVSLLINSKEQIIVVKLKSLLKCDHLVVFGDGENDIEMFQLADEAYAVDNAHEKLKAIATQIIPSNDQDGVAQFLKKTYQKL